LGSQVGDELLGPGAGGPGGWGGRHWGDGSGKTCADGEGNKEPCASNEDR
jgi:hypothetical protein